MTQGASLPGRAIWLPSFPNSYMLAETRNGVVALARREIYSSPNGDRWFLARDPDSGQGFVVHEPNPASGGQPSQIDIGRFLSRGERGPEHQELLRLIGSLVEEGSSA
jgi:hypothetical protein